MKTDKQLQTDVIAELSWEPSVHAAEIGVEVKDGVVTLAGHVSSYAEKWNAERAAQRVSGVKALAIEMDVKLPAFGKRNDADIATSATNMLSWATLVPDDAINVLVEKGWITLSGAVDWQYQKQAAADAVRFLIGVDRRQRPDRDQADRDDERGEGRHRGRFEPARRARREEDLGPGRWQRGDADRHGAQPCRARTRHELRLGHARRSQCRRRHDAHILSAKRPNVNKKDTPP